MSKNYNYLPVSVSGAAPHILDFQVFASGVLHEFITKHLIGVTTSACALPVYDTVHLSMFWPLYDTLNPAGVSLRLGELWAN